MKVLFFRHATRSPYGLDDSGLTAQGQLQAEAIAKAVGSRLPPPTGLLVSPKRRAQETFRPLARKTKLSLTIDDRLDERANSEAGRAFQNRVQALLETFASAWASDGCVYLCSHMDWLEAAMIALPSDLTDLEISAAWSNAEFKLFQLERDGLWRHLESGVISPAP